MSFRLCLLFMAAICLLGGSINAFWTNEAIRISRKYTPKMCAPPSDSLFYNRTVGRVVGYIALLAGVVFFALSLLSGFAL